MKSLFSTMVVLVAGVSASACDKPVQVRLAEPAPVKVLTAAADDYCQQAKAALANAPYGANTVAVVGGSVKVVRVNSVHNVALANTHTVAVVKAQAVAHATNVGAVAAAHAKVGLAAPANNGVNVTVVNQPQQRQGFLGRLLGRNRTKTKVVVRQ
jgi:hypothetical protein